MNELSPIPVVDLAPFQHGTEAEQAVVAGEIHRALTETGFLYVRNYGLSEADRHALFTHGKSFFALDEAVKREVAYRSTEDNTGYVAVERERLDPSRPGDLKEAFNLRDPRMANDRNLWPDDALPDFRPAMERAYETFVGVSHTLLRAFAMALDLPLEYFVERHAARNQTMRLLHYPPTPENQVQPEQTGAGAHTDYGAITLLLQDDLGGLEAMMRDGRWVSVTPIPGTAVINVGDLMQRWTNDVFRSTPHRVRPTSGHSERARQSIVFFSYPDYDTDITVIPSCVKPGADALYGPISAHGYLQERLNGTY